jgi:hypothetical protein
MEGAGLLSPALVTSKAYIIFLCKGDVCAPEHKARAEELPRMPNSRSSQHLPSMRLGE